MGSFSSESDGTTPSQIVSKFEGAQQFSREELLEQRISWIGDKDTRQKCERDLQFLKQHAIELQNRERLAEDAYVDERLKLDSNLTPGLGGNQLSYEQRVNALRKEYQQTPEAIAMTMAHAEQREIGRHDLEGRVEDALRVGKTKEQTPLRAINKVFNLNSR